MNRTIARARKMSTQLGLLTKKLEFLASWKASLATAIAIVLLVVLGRFYYSSVTGFIVPDEAWYYNTFVLSQAPIASYREVFVTIFVLFFHGLNSVWTFLLLGALYEAIWGVGCVLLFFMILRRLKAPEGMTSLLMLSLPLFPVFLVFVPAVLTETLGLFIVLVGTYFALRYVQQGGAFNSLLSGVFFVLACYVHEQLLLFAVGNALLFLIVSLKRRSLLGFLGYAIPVSSVFPIPVSFQPFQVIWLRDWITQFVTSMLYVISQTTSHVTTMTSQTATISQIITSKTQLPTLPPPASTFIPLTFAWHPDLPMAILVGLAYGFNPLFAIFAVLSILVTAYDLFRRKSLTDLFLVLNALMSFGAFILPTLFLLQQLGGALTGWTSSIIRTTHAALPSIAGFPSVYRRLKTRRVAALTLIVLIVGATQVGTAASEFQRSLSRLPVDRLSLDYRAPYYRMYLIAKDSGRALIFGGLHMRGIRMYMNMLPNVRLVDVNGLDEGRFRSLLNQTWDSFFLYDDWVTIAVPYMIDMYPNYYANLLRSLQYPGYQIQTLWVDGESYALKMTPTSTTGTIALHLPTEQTLCFADNSPKTNHLFG